MDKIKLFCLPYAGGSAMIYNRWKKYLYNMVELFPVEMTGRGRRFSEPFYPDIGSAVNDLYLSIKDMLYNSDYAFYGHSMGSLLAYGLIGKLREMGHHSPVHAFFSGRYPPHLSKDDKMHTLPDDEFMEGIMKYGGTPKEFLENNELLKIFIPILKADYRIINSYEHNMKFEKLECPITIINGTDDIEVAGYDLNEWSMYTSSECNFVEFHGGHFFINEKVEELVGIINNILLGSLDLKKQNMCLL